MEAALPMDARIASIPGRQENDEMVSSTFWVPAYHAGQHQIHPTDQTDRSELHGASVSCQRHSLAGYSSPNKVIAVNCMALVCCWRLSGIRILVRLWLRSLAFCQSAYRSSHPPRHVELTA